MQPKYPNVLYSTEASAFIMGMVALQRANGVPVEESLDWAVARYWREFAKPRGSFSLDDLRAFIRDVAPPAARARPGADGLSHAARDGRSTRPGEAT